MKGKAFCPQCGKTDEKLFSGLCRSCFIEKISLIHVPEQMEVTICTQCGSTQKKGKWTDSDLSMEDQVVETIAEQIEVDGSVKDVDISIGILNIRGSTFQCLVEVKGEVLGEIVSQDSPVEIRVNKNVCSECSKYASGYYEAVIQIRADERLPSSEEIKFADEIIKTRIKQLSDKNRLAYISQRIEIKEGVDYYVGSYKAARKLTDALKNELGGILKESPRLMGRDKSRGKDLYRIWISLRLPQFQKGDFVGYKDMKAQVHDFDGSKVYLQDIESSSRTSVPWKECGNFRIIARKEDIKTALVSAKTPHSLQILHPETYQPIDIEIGPELSSVEIGEELEVVEIDNNFNVLKPDQIKK